MGRVAGRVGGWAGAARSRRSRHAEGGSAADRQGQAERDQTTEKLFDGCTHVIPLDDELPRVVITQARSVPNARGEGRRFKDGRPLGTARAAARSGLPVA